MKKIFLFYMALFIINTLQAQVRLPSPSPTQTIKQEFGLGNIELSYTRTGAKGRRVFGDLVSYGKLWNTSANTPSKLFFSEPVEIFGKKIDQRKQGTGDLGNFVAHHFGASFCASGHLV